MNGNRLYQNLDFSFDIEGLSVHVLTIALCRPVTQVPFHSHGAGCYELHFISSGKGKIQLKDGYFHTAPASFYMAGPHTGHSELSYPEEPMEEYCIYFHMDAAALRAASRKSPLLGALVSQDLFLGRDNRRLFELFEELKSEMDIRALGYREYLCALLKQIFVLCIRSSQTSSREHNALSSQNMVLQKSVIAEDYFL